MLTYFFGSTLQCVGVVVGVGLGLTLDFIYILSDREIETNLLLQESDVFRL